MNWFRLSNTARAIARALLLSALACSIEFLPSADKKLGRNRVCIADVEMASAQDMLIPAGSEQTKERVVVQSLTAAASAHDRGTSAHAQRMVRLAEATARLLGRPEEELHLIRLGALLHDIGKIGIPEAILHKPGPLTDEEWTVMRRHPDIGQQILEQMGGDLSAAVPCHRGPP